MAPLRFAGPGLVTQFSSGQLHGIASRPVRHRVSAAGHDGGISPRLGACTGLDLE